MNLDKKTMNKILKLSTLRFRELIKWRKRSKPVPRKGKWHGEKTPTFAAILPLGQLPILKRKQTGLNGTFFIFRNES